MNTQQLTDELIRSAIARRVAAAAEGDLHVRVHAATAATPQRRGWRVRLDGERLLPQRGLALRLSVAIVLLATVALLAVLIGSQTNRTTPAPLGGLAYLYQGDLYVAGPAGESPRLVWDLPATDDLAPTQLTWLDPVHVLLETYAASGGGIHLVDIATGAQHVLDSGQFVALSPDRRIVAVSTYDERATPPEGVGLIEIATGAVVGEIPGSLRGYPATWSPDGRFIVDEEPKAILRVDVANGERSTLAAGLCCGLSPHWPTWSPDGARIVYVDYHLPGLAGDCEFRCGTLWAAPAAGAGEPTRLTPELGSEILPAFSPDGRWIAYINECPCLDAKTIGIVSDGLILIAADGSGARVLAPDPRALPTTNPAGYLTTPGGVPGRQFSWDPDSAGITYLTKDATIWHVTLDGIARQLEGSAISEFARQVLP